MHPWHYGPHAGHHFHHFHRRGPRRFVWFLIGAGVATWWIKQKEEQRRLGYDGGSWGAWGPWGHCAQRQAIQPAPQYSEQAQASTPQQPQQPQQSHHWGWSREHRWNGPQPTAAPVTAAASPEVTVEEKVQVRPQSQEYNVGQQAGDKLVELSEATLDTVLTTVEVLKAKLAEHRAEREKSQGGDKKDSSPRMV